MKFRTEITIQQDKNKIEQNNKVVTIGSCFAENMAEYFNLNRFKILANPFGVLYNPVSILNSLKIITDSRIFSEKDLVFHQSEWHSFSHHSSFSHHEKNVILSSINKNIKTSYEFLKSADWMLITFGTSYVYKYIPSGEIVSNCHKIPQKKFEHYRLSLEETQNTISSIIKLASSFNPKIRLMFTVSPVRHWKDGAHNNQLSKATLLLAINEAIKSSSNSVYFPSYEIVMDDLRDYRFYNSDLVHPNKMATDYIWEKLIDSFCSEKCLEIMNEISKINSAKNHRARNVNSEEHQKFIGKILDKIMQLGNTYKHLDLTQDSEYFRSQLNKINK